MCVCVCVCVVCVCVCTLVPTDVAHLCLVVEQDKRTMGMWLPFAEEAIGTIYALCDSPAMVCGPIIKALSQTCFAPVDGAQASTTLPSTCLLAVVGHVALKQLVHMENIMSELKRRRNAKSANTGSDKKKGKGGKGKKDAGEGDKENMDDVLGMGNAAKDEEEAEYIQHVCENELVLPEVRRGCCV